MTHYLPGIFALLVAAAGWFYLFYSRAAERLSVVEQPELNKKRTRLRRVGGVSMCLLGVAFFAGSYTFNIDTHRLAFTLTWLGVLVLLVVVTVSGLMDLRLTMRLRGRQKKQ